jgi:hypothetical protein
MREAEAARLAPTVTAIARALGVPPSTLSRALNDEGRPGAELLARLRCKFGPSGFARIVSLDCTRAAWCGPIADDEVLVPRRIVPKAR